MTIVHQKCAKLPIAFTSNEMLISPWQPPCFDERYDGGIAFCIAGFILGFFLWSTWKHLNNLSMYHMQIPNRVVYIVQIVSSESKQVDDILSIVSNSKT